MLGVDGVIGRGDSAIEGMVAAVILPVRHQLTICVYGIRHESERHRTNRRVLNGGAAFATVVEVRTTRHCEAGISGEGRLVWSGLWVLLFHFAIDEEVVQDSAWTPYPTICPSLDA